MDGRSPQTPLQLSDPPFPWQGGTCYQVVIWRCQLTGGGESKPLKTLKRNEDITSYKNQC